MTMELISTPTRDSAIDASATMYPSRMTALRGQAEFSNPTSSYFGYVVDGSVQLETRTLEVSGRAGTYFACPGPVQLCSDGLTIVIERLGYRCLPQVGSVEAQGRLAYIDGCSDTVLVAPARQGDPVLNLLHFPTGVRQSVHSHPSIRLGVVAGGEGTAFGPGPGGADWRIALRPGSMFMLPAHEMHAFSTAESDSSLDIIAFHPDSDWGPTDGVHPMLNRTYLR
jgi:quercetin dioxygenase-like cupin family protein